MTHAFGPPIICHPDTGFVLVAGDDAIDFLQSIVTANVATLEIGACRPSALLTPQGRILIDMMIYRPHATQFILRTDAARRDDLYTRLRRYRLRRPVDLGILEDMKLAIHMPGDLPNEMPNEMISAAVMIFTDPRDSNLGQHILFRADQDLTALAMPDTSNDQPPSEADAEIDFTGAYIDNWHARRIAGGIPEGAIDLTPERALMLEAGLDTLGAVDFEKGCYVGQEVTARTHYRGLVKRRLVPIIIDGAAPATDSDITWNDTIIGTSKTAANIPNAQNTPNGSICLALLKLSDIHAINDNAGQLLAGGNAGTLALPAWMQPLPKAK